MDGGFWIIHKVACVKTYDVAVQFMQQWSKSPSISITATWHLRKRDDKAERNFTGVGQQGVARPGDITVEYEILFNKNAPQ